MSAPKRKPSPALEPEFVTQTEDDADPSIKAAPQPDPVFVEETDAPATPEPELKAAPARDRIKTLIKESNAQAAMANELQAEPEKPEPRDVAKPALQARELDSGVADILREEAAFETAARRKDDNPLETQPDLDLSRNIDADRRERMAKERGEDGIAAAVSATIAQDADAPRRELLPDIEEINSSLRPDATPGHVDIDDDFLGKRDGFKRGFMLVVVLALIGLGVYVFADQISTSVPALGDSLASYVGWVDGLRVQLDDVLRGFITTTEGDVSAPTADG